MPHRRLVASTTLLAAVLGGPVSAVEELADPTAELLQALAEEAGCDGPPKPAEHSGTAGYQEVQAAIDGIATAIRCDVSPTAERKMLPHFSALRERPQASVLMLRERYEAASVGSPQRFLVLYILQFLRLPEALPFLEEIARAPLEPSFEEQPGPKKRARRHGPGPFEADAIDHRYAVDAIAALPAGGARAGEGLEVLLRITSTADEEVAAHAGVMACIAAETVDQPLARSLVSQGRSHLVPRTCPGLAPSSRLRVTLEELAAREVEP